MRTRKVVVYRDTKNEWRYRVVAGNGRVVAASEEGFKQLRTIQKRIEKYWPDAEVVEV